MKNFKKIAIFIVTALVLCSLLSVSTLAAAEPVGTQSAEESVEAADKTDGGKLDMDMIPETFEKRLEYALQGTVTGMLMVFGVLTLLTLILYGSKYIFYDIPNRKKDRARPVEHEATIIAAQPTEQVAFPTHASPAAVATAQDDGEIAAVITAAIAAMIESGDYKNEFAGGFRVVSFKRSTQGAWNRK